MIKITIFGSYNRGSIGDTAILLGLLSSLQRIYGKNIEVNILVFKELGLRNELERFNIDISVNEVVIDKLNNYTGVFSSVLNFYKRIKRKLFNESILDLPKSAKTINNADILILGGGNLIMDLYPRWPFMFRQICDLAIKSNTKYYILGVGAGPIDTNHGLTVFEKYLKKAEMVLFRDLESKEYCERKINFKNASLIPDLALGLNIEPSHDVSNKSILINVASVYGELWPVKNAAMFDKYIKGMVKLTFLIHDYYDFNELIIFNSNSPTDQQGMDSFSSLLQKNKFKNKIKVITGEKSVFELVKLGETATYAITTRLHAGIMVYKGGSKIIGVGYQPKVKDILEGSGISEAVIDLNDLLIWDSKKINQKLKDAFRQNTSQKPQNFTKKIDEIIYNVLSSSQNFRIK